jgi:uncharacterized membrane protein
MNLSPAKLLRGLVVLCLLIAWAALAHYGSVGEGNPNLGAALATAPIVAIAVILLWRLGNPLWIALGGAGVLAAVATSWPYLRDNIALLYFVQHLGTNLALGTLFGISLFGEKTALITKFALLAHNGHISAEKTRYTRQVTVAWTAFFFITAATSFILFFWAPPTAWSIFANLLPIPLILLMFGIEHLIRHRVLPPADRSSIADTIRGYQAGRQNINVSVGKRP